MKEEKPPSNKFEYRCPLNPIEGVRHKSPFTLRKGCNLNILVGVTRTCIVGTRGGAEGREGGLPGGVPPPCFFLYLYTSRAALYPRGKPNTQPPAPRPFRSIIKVISVIVTGVRFWLIREYRRERGPDRQVTRSPPRIRQLHDGNWRNFRDLESFDDRKLGLKSFLVHIVATHLHVRKNRANGSQLESK